MKSPTIRVDVNARVLEHAKKRLAGATKKVAAHRVTVGIHEAEGAATKKNYKGDDSDITLIEAAVCNEFGTDVIPERSWFRDWFDQNRDRAEKEMTEAMRAEYRGEKNAVADLAARWGDEMRARVESGAAAFEPLAGWTRAARARAGVSEDPPLFAAGQLVAAMRAKIDGRPA